MATVDVQIFTIYCLSATIVATHLKKKLIFKAGDKSTKPNIEVTEQWK